jgi:Ca-activated chloride channel homolog
MIASLTFAAIWPSFPIRRSVVRRAGRLLIPAALSIVSLLNSPPARAESQNALAVPIAAKPNAMRSGALLVKDDDGRYAEAPRLGTDVHVVVSGPTARAHVTLMFQNPSERWIEAVYVYPLSDGGSVDTLKMIVGDRIVVGEIKGRPEAREAYENAKAAGQKAALIEQRPAQSGSSLWRERCRQVPPSTANGVATPDEIDSVARAVVDPHL